MSSHAKSVTVCVSTSAKNAAAVEYRKKIRGQSITVQTGYQCHVGVITNANVVNKTFQKSSTQASSKGRIIVSPALSAKIFLHLTRSKRSKHLMSILTVRLF